MIAVSQLTLRTHIEILSKNVSHISVPYFESLSLEKIQLFCQRHPNEINQYFPDKQELHKISRT